MIEGSEDRVEFIALNNAIDNPSIDSKLTLKSN